jgi:hypothetical protein
VSPAGPPWREDRSQDEAKIARNVRDLLAQLAADAPARAQPTVSLAHQWHQGVYRGVAVPSNVYLGAPRGVAHPHLISYEVVLRDAASSRVVAQGVPAREVAGELSAFEKAVQTATATLDAAIPVGAQPNDGAELLAVVELAALTHGEWVRIHPYANGNGRIARIWANWVALRYGLPPFIRIKPRPDGLLYAQVAQMSMAGDHRATVSLFVDLLRQRP